jgi:hypothetical protein
MVDSLPRGVVGDLRSRYHELLRDTVDAVANRPWAEARPPCSSPCQPQPTLLGQRISAASYTSRHPVEQPFSSSWSYPPGSRRERLDPERTDTAPWPPGGSSIRCLGPPTSISSDRLLTSAAWRKEESTFLDIRSVLISTCGERPHKRFNLAGHQDLTTTQRYMHLSPAALKSADHACSATEQGSPDQKCFRRARAPTDASAALGR